MEEVQPQEVIMFAGFPDKGDKAEWGSFLKIVGFDRAMSASVAGFGKDGKEGEDDGAWSVPGLPTVSELGKQNPSPWSLFMDWMWKFLKEKGYNPAPASGFGDVKTPYGKLKPYQKRQRKYGVPADIQPEQLHKMSPKEVKQFAHGWPSKQYSEMGIIPGGGYDVKRDVTIAISPMGNDMDQVFKNLDKIFKSAPIPSWFKIRSDENNYRWAVSVDIDADDMPEGWRERRTSIDAFRHENRERWNNTISTLSGGRTNPLQLAPLVRAFLVVKHGFQPPMSVDVLSKEDFDKAVAIIKNTSLEDVVQFAKETGRPVPVISQASAARDSIKSKLMTRWHQAVQRLADQGAVESYVVQVALADHMVKRVGFPEPFEIDELTPQQLSRVLTVASRLMYSDLDVSSVEDDIERLREEDPRDLLKGEGEDPQDPLSGDKTSDSAQ